MRAGRRIAPRNKSGRRVSGRGPSAYTALCTFSPRCSNTRNRAYATMSVTGMAKIISIRPGSFGGFFVEQLAQAGGQLLIAHLVGGSSPLLFCGSARTRLRRRQADATQPKTPRRAVGTRAYGNLRDGAFTTVVAKCGLHHKLMGSRWINTDAELRSNLQLSSHVIPRSGSNPCERSLLFTQRPHSSMRRKRLQSNGLDEIQPRVSFALYSGRLQHKRAGRVRAGRAPR